jgi:hypothetical protein
METECSLTHEIEYIKITRPIVNKINGSIRKKINKAHYKKIPFDLLEDALRENGFVPVNEDATRFSAILCGADGNANINYARSDSFDPIMFGMGRGGGSSALNVGFGGYKKIVENSTIILSWHFLTTEYEITVYAS